MVAPMQVDRGHTSPPPLPRIAWSSDGYAARSKRSLGRRRSPPMCWTSRQLRLRAARWRSEFDATPCSPAWHGRNRAPHGRSWARYRAEGGGFPTTQPTRVSRVQCEVMQQRAQTPADL